MNPATISQKKIFDQFRKTRKTQSPTVNLTNVEKTSQIAFPTTNLTTTLASEIQSPLTSTAPISNVDHVTRATNLPNVSTLNTSSVQSEFNTSNLEPDALHKLIMTASNSNIQIGSSADILKISATQKICDNLQTKPAIQLQMKDVNAWKGYIICHPSSPQNSDSNNVYTGNKMFVVYQTSNVMNPQNEIDELVKNKAVSLYSKTSFKPKQKEFQASLYSSLSNIILISNGLDFEELPNVKVCFSAHDLTNLKITQLKMIKFSFWPTNIVIPELTEISRSFNLLKIHQLSTIEMPINDAKTSFFIVTNDKYSDQNPNVLEFVQSHQNSDLIISKINDMYMKFETSGKKSDFLFGICPINGNEIQLQNNVIDAHYLFMMVNPNKIKLDNTLIYSALFSHFNKFVVAPCLIDVYLSDLLNINDMFATTFALLQNFFESIGMTTIMLQANFDRPSSTNLNSNDISSDLCHTDDNLSLPIHEDATAEELSDISKLSNHANVLKTDLSQLFPNMPITSFQPTPSTSTAEQDAVPTIVIESANTVDVTSNVHLTKPLGWASESSESDREEISERTTPIDESEDENQEYANFLQNEKLIRFAKRYASEHEDDSEMLKTMVMSLQATNHALRKDNQTLLDANALLQVKSKELSEMLNIIKIDFADLQQNFEIQNENFSAVSRDYQILLEKYKQVTSAQSVPTSSSSSFSTPLFESCLASVTVLKNEFPHLYQGVDSVYGNIDALLTLFDIKLKTLTQVCQLNPAVHIGVLSHYGLTVSTEYVVSDDKDILLGVPIEHLRIVNTDNTLRESISGDLFHFTSLLKLFWALV
jgi:hypothetical protein